LQTLQKSHTRQNCEEIIVDERVSGIACKSLCSCGALDPEKAPVASLNQAGAFFFCPLQSSSGKQLPAIAPGKRAA